jgi:hypothetical protein
MWKFLIICFIFVLLAVGAFYFVFYSHFLDVAAVKISGSARTDEIKIVLIDVISKNSKIRSLLGPGNLLFWPSKISQIPPSLFWLSDLSLKTNWDQKEISVEVKERQPWLLWCLSTQTSSPAPAINTGSSTVSQTASTTLNNCYWADEGGVVFSLAPEAEGYLIPRVFEKNGRQALNLGQLFIGNSQLAKNTLEIIGKMENSPLIVRRFLIEKIDLQELTAETNSLPAQAGPKLYFSLRFVPRDLDKIIVNLNDHLNFKKLEYIDFRVENRIYYK